MSHSAIQPRPLIEVGPDFAEELGLDWKCDRHEVVKKINEMREMLYLDPEMPRLFTEKFYCCKIQCFREPCINPCGCDYVEDDCTDVKFVTRPSGAHYYGIVIPADIDGVLTVWADKQPLRGYSRWWEGRFHRITKDCGPCLSWTMVHQTFPTEVSMVEPSTLNIYAEHPEDQGKCVVVTVLDDPKGKPKEIHFNLEGDGVTTSEMIVHDIVQVVLPPNLKGCITLSAGDLELSTYSPHTTVPCYRRLKITTPCDEEQVLIHGSQKFEPICFDSDIVEIGSRLLLKHAAKIFRYGDNGTESDELTKARIEEQKFKSLIRGAIERKRGNAKQDPSIFVRRRLHRETSLYRRCRKGGCHG